MRVHFNESLTKAYGDEDDFEDSDDFREAVEDEYKAMTGKSCTPSNFDFDEYVIPREQDLMKIMKVSEMEHGWYWTADIEEVKK